MSVCSFPILTLNLVLTHGIRSDVHGGVHIYLLAPHTVGLVPSLSGRAIAYRWRSLPRVRWHRALKVVRVTIAAFASPWTKFYCASLFSHTHYWYKMSMFKLSGVYQNISTDVLLYCFVDPFFAPTYGLYKCKESSVHGRISSAMCQNVVLSVILLLYYGPDFSPPTYICTSVKSPVYTVQYRLLLNFKTRLLLHYLGPVFPPPTFACTSVNICSNLLTAMVTEKKTYASLPGLKMPVFLYIWVKSAGLSDLGILSISNTTSVNREKNYLALVFIFMSAAWQTILKLVS